MAIEKWSDHVLNPTAPTDAASLQETADKVFELEGGVFGMNRVEIKSSIRLSEILDKPVNGEHLAMVLRITARYQESVIGWPAAYALARETLIKEGKDPADALFGLSLASDALFGILQNVDASANQKPAAGTYRHLWELVVMDQSSLIDFQLARIPFTTENAQRRLTAIECADFLRSKGLLKIPSDPRRPLTVYVRDLGPIDQLLHFPEL